MSYQVLARKWRPQTFSQVVGQEHVLTALANGLSLGRIHHAYLLSGTRGVGKTTIARLLAKGLNCETGITATPCGHCDNCREIEQGRFVDLIEIDAASRTKVEDTRDLLDNVQYAPARGRFKVYLIDEVHMLSRHSFNALLKTLEEPPSHVKFLLATTDPQKLPVTILSRCLQFHLKALDVGQIRGQLEHVLGAEKINSEPRALQLLARAADGSMRDALSLTDQAIAIGQGQVSTAAVSDMLGTLDSEQPLALIEAMVAADGNQMMARLAEAASRGTDWETLLVEMLTLLHRIAMGQLLPDALSAEEDSAIAPRLRELARTIPPADLQLYYQTLLVGRKELPFAPDRRMGVEMTLLRALAFHPRFIDDAPDAPAADGEKKTAENPGLNQSRGEFNSPAALAAAPPQGVANARRQLEASSQARAKAAPRTAEAGALRTADTLKAAEMESPKAAKTSLPPPVDSPASAKARWQKTDNRPAAEDNVPLAMPDAPQDAEDTFHDYPQADATLAGPAADRQENGDYADEWARMMSQDDNERSPEPTEPVQPLPDATAKLLQARSALLSRQEQHKAKKDDPASTPVKPGNAGSALERLASVGERAQQRSQSSGHAGTAPKPAKPDAYRWRASVQPQAVAEPVTTPKALRTALEHEKTPELSARLAEEAILRDPWAAQVSRMKIPKLVQQLALNAAREDLAPGKVCLHLRSAQRHLNSDSARETLGNALAVELGAPVELSVTEDDNPALRTPLEWRQAIYEEKLLQARLAINADSHIQTLQRFFDAVLDEDSIRPV